MSITTQGYYFSTDYGFLIKILHDLTVKFARDYGFRFAAFDIETNEEFLIGGLYYSKDDSLHP